MGLRETQQKIEALIRKEGMSNVWFAIKKFRLRRVDPNREKRKRFPRAMYQRLYDKQGGTCACKREEQLLVPAMKNWIDHKDPNAGNDFNRLSNLQLMLPECNREKSSKSIHEQSKESGRTYGALV